MASNGSGDRAQGADFTVPLVINGEEIRTDKTFDVVSPSTGKALHRCSAASVADAGAAVDAAAEALKSWRRSTPAQRRDVFLKAAEVFERRRDELARYAVEETGATEAWSGVDAHMSSEMLKDVAGRASSLEGTFPAMGDPNTSGIVMREPYGVVLAIAPWNAPMILGFRSFSLPILAGNTVVFKASETSPRTLGAVVSVLHEAGLPKGVLNMIVHERSAAADITEALIADPRVKKINFTGSTAVGRAIGRLAGEHLKPVVLELGGKAPAIVWDDADVRLAAEQCALASFMHSGQVCMSTERILVHRAVRDRFVDELKAAVERAFPASGSAMTLISGAAVRKNRELVADATRKGASVVLGDLEPREAGETRMRPIVVGKVTPDMDIYRTESFGPTVSVLDVDSEEEAIRIANDTEYGLTAAVFTEDLRRGLRFAREIETGAVHINGMTIHDETVLPHGGAKASGFGRFNGPRGLDEWVRTKNVTFRN